MEDRIIKISENNVEVTPSKKVTTTDNQVVTIWDEDKKESFGQDGIDSQLSSAQKELTNAKVFDEVTYKKNLTVKVQAKIDRLGLIQKEMDRGGNNG